MRSASRSTLTNCEKLETRPLVNLFLAICHLLAKPNGNGIYPIDSVISTLIVIRFAYHDIVSLGAHSFTKSDFFIIHQVISSSKSLVFLTMAFVL